jgi:hypothetical protein
LHEKGVTLHEGPMSTRHYTDVPALRNIYLEDSFVLDIVATPGHVVFRIELVLTPQHPAYAAPRPSEHHCYRRGELVFNQVRELLWTHSGLLPARDASGEHDYGGVDIFL